LTAQILLDCFGPILLFLHNGPNAACQVSKEMLLPPPEIFQ